MSHTFDTYCVSAENLKELFVCFSVKGDLYEISYICGLVLNFGVVIDVKQETCWWIPNKSMKSWRLLNLGVTFNDIYQEASLKTHIEMCMQDLSICKIFQEIVLYISEANLKKYIGNKCARFRCVQILSRHGTHMRKYHQVIGLKCKKYRKDELSKYIHWWKIKWGV